MNIYEKAAAVGLGYIKAWLPDGEEENGQWSATNPLRHDVHRGSFKINLETGAFNDYADDEMVGRDAVTLYAKLNGLSNFEAAKEILEKYDPTYFPVAYGKEVEKEEWRQVTRPMKNAPELPMQKNEVARWALEKRHGDLWLPVMWVVRIMKGETKTDYPYTLFSNAKNYEWRCKALKGTTYPLYNARSLEEKPNARVLLVEGQKVASVVKDYLTTWAVVGWYGGAQSIGLSDLSVLMGREVYFSFDADAPGRQAIEKLEKILPNTKIHLVYPPSDVAQGWDLADAIKDGWTQERLEEHILKDEPKPAVTEDNLPEVQHISPCLTPIRFTAVSEQEKFFLRNLLTEEKNCGVDKQTGTVHTRVLLRDNWIGLWVEHDRQLKNSIMMDYTTGLKQTAYSSKSEWLGAIEHRADELEIPQSSLTDSALKKIERAIELQGKKYNRVIDFIDELKNLYPVKNRTRSKLFDEFMKIFTFNVERFENEPLDHYVERKAYILKLYRELWFKYLLRMHGHINGTRKNEDGTYYGLLPNDIVPVLVGGQGIGKTTFVQWLAMEDELYSDLGSGLKSKFGNEETFKKIRGKLIVELGEMKIMRDSNDIEQVKSFVSKTTSDIDIKYVEQQYQTPVTASYIGTSNPMQFLSDNTGNRRFSPVKLENIDLNFISSNKGKELIRQIHVFFNDLALSMNKEDLLAWVTFSPELEAFMEQSCKEALITYSDYEACVTVIKRWWNGWVDHPAAAPGAELQQADIERMCYEQGYHMRISQKSCDRAIKDCGLKRIIKKEAGSIKIVWIKPTKEEKTPF